MAVRIYLDVPYREKDTAKALGAKWDFNIRKWYYEDVSKKGLFSRWETPALKKASHSHKRNDMCYDKLSDEQKAVIDFARSGENVLVDACIGSGKTTSIQILCDELQDKKILYLTYNHLLKIDAQSKIVNPRVVVQNYHGFAYGALRKSGGDLGLSDLIQNFNKTKPQIPYFDVIVIDEYQDIETELAEMLWIIKAAQEVNHKLQLVIVGDLQQKIYDKTTLHVPDFINEFLNDYTLLHYTICFRLNEAYAKMIGECWHKEIIGVNNNCQISTMTIPQVIQFLAHQEISDILCLGSRTGGDMSHVLNTLENRFPKKFNKNTVYASIKDEDRGSIVLGKDAAIFTTYDSSKGLEKPICVVFDFSISYWTARLGQPQAKYEIIRNIFLVAASRGKDKIIFVQPSKSEMLTFDIIAEPFGNQLPAFKPFDVSDMFDFKYVEDIEACYKLLTIEDIPQDETTEICPKSNDGYIDLSPCIGILLQAKYFDKFSIDELRLFLADKYKNDRSLPVRKLPRLDKEKDLNWKYLTTDQKWGLLTLEEKILHILWYSTLQERYVLQVGHGSKFIEEEHLDEICTRLSKVFRKDEEVEVTQHMKFFSPAHEIELGDGNLDIVGRCDVLRDDEVWELKFVSDIQHTHCLQTAMYMIMNNREVGKLWNVKMNTMKKITIKDKKKFLDAVVNCITKGVVTEFQEETQSIPF